MKKVLVLLVAVCFMVLGASTAKADTRTDSLGLTAGQQVDDLDSIFLFPQDAASFGNVVDLRLGNPNGFNGQDWGGVIHKDWDNVGYFGIYTNKPFNMSDGITPNTPAANQNGILNGWTTWEHSLSPYYSAYLTANANGNTGTRAGSGSLNDITAHYAHINVQLVLNNVRLQDPQNKLDLFWANDYSDIALGMHVNYASQDGNRIFADGYGNANGVFTPGAGPVANTRYNESGNEGSSVLGLDLGLGLKNVGPLDSLNGSLGYSLGSVDYFSKVGFENAALTGTNPSTSTIKDNNISEIRANLLGKLKINDNSTGRVYLMGRFDNLGIVGALRNDSTNAGSYSVNAGDTVNTANSYSDTNINLGFACDHNVADGKAKVIVGVDLIYDGRAWTQSGASNLAGSATADQLFVGSGSMMNEDWWVVPFNVAIEAPVFSWLKVRVGANDNLFQSITAKVVQKTNRNVAGTAFQDTTTDSQTMDIPNPINLSYGLSSTIDNFTMDVQVSPNILLNNLQNFEPGSGILFGSNGTSDNADVGSPAMIFGMFVQADVRYAF